MCAKRDISDGRVDMWRTIALEKVSIVAIFCSAAPTTPAIEPFSFRISTLTLSVSCDDHFAKTIVSVHPTSKSTASMITSVENVRK